MQKVVKLHSSYYYLIHLSPTFGCAPVPLLIWASIILLYSRELSKTKLPLHRYIREHLYATLRRFTTIEILLHITDTIWQAIIVFIEALSYIQCNKYKSMPTYLKVFILIMLCKSKTYQRKFFLKNFLNRITLYFIFEYRGKNL